MILMDDELFKEKLTGGLKKDIKDLVNFHASSCKSEIFTLMGSFCPKHTKFYMKNYRRVLSYEIEE